MNLAIDIGNTVNKLATFRDGIIVDKEFDSGELSENVVRRIAGNEVKSIIISSVKERDEKLIENLREDYNVIELSHETSLPVTNKYETPQALGKDRIAAVIGAITHFKNSHILVIDAGTCMTFEFINDKNEYLGGAISPGLQMRFRAMNTFTAKLPLVIPDKNFVDLIGKTTQTSMLSGVQNGMVAEIDGAIEAYKSVYRDIKVLITGGDAEFFAKKLKNRIFVAPDLVLEGLNEILNYNVQS